MLFRSPYKAGKLNVKAARSGRKVTFDCALETPGNKNVGHIFRVTVFDGKGKKAEAFSTLLHAETNRGTYSFVLPVSGDWQKGKAVVTDVMTGVTAAVQF